MRGWCGACLACNALVVTHAHSTVSATQHQQPLLPAPAVSRGRLLPACRTHAAASPAPTPAAAPRHPAAAQTTAGTLQHGNGSNKHGVWAQPRGGESGRQPCVPTHTLEAWLPHQHTHTRHTHRRAASVDESSHTCGTQTSAAASSRGAPVAGSAASSLLRGVVAPLVCVARLFTSSSTPGC